MTRTDAIAPQIVRNVACTVCGCVCDDLELEVHRGDLRVLSGSCSLADPWFAALRNGGERGAVQIEGQSATYDDAIVRAAEILRASQSPLVFGLSRSSTHGQQVAVRLADYLGANIDTTASVCHGPSIMAIQQSGESTSSLGEVRHRADVIVFWGANPAVTHPRHFERYSIDASGQWIPGGRADRTVIVIDSEMTETAKRADVFLQVPKGRDFETIWALRQAIRSDLPAPRLPDGLNADQFQFIADRICNCRYGAVFFGLGLAQQGIGHANVSALLELVRDLNAHTRFVARRLRIPGDVTGADLVLCWQTGFPFAVNLAREYPRYNPGEYSANELLARKEVDACLLVGSESVTEFSPEARDHLASIPVIGLDYPHLKPQVAATVQFTTAVYGIHAAGTAYRMDEVPIPLRRILPSSYPTDDAVLQAILDRLTSVGSPTEID